MSAHDDVGADEFKALYERHARRLWAYLARASGAADTADDLMQECFLRYLRARPRLDTDEHRKNYLYRIATNLLCDRHRQQRTEPEPLTEEPAGPQAENEAGLLARHDVMRLLPRLSLRQRQLLWLAYVEGLNHREIAEQLDVGRDSVRQLLLRARRRLVQLYRGEALPEDDG